MLKRTFFYIFSLLSIIVNAQFRNYSNEFLNIGVDAQALGMSKSVVATSNDVNAVYWNPSGLIHVKDYQGSLMYASYFANIAGYNFASFAMPVDEKSALGLSIIRFGVDDIMNTTQLIDSEGNIDYNRISLFSATDYAFSIGYARKMISDKLHFGMNAKIIRRIIGDFASSWGFGFDAGIQYTYKDWQLGLMARDITTTYNTWAINEGEFEKIKNAIPDKNQELPETTEITKPKLQLGVAKKFEINQKINLLTELDLHTRFAETNDIISTSVVSVSPSLGVQLDYNNLVFLRGGLGNFQQTTEFDKSKSISAQPNFGIGFHYKGIKIDYALTNIGSSGNALYSNIFSLKFDYSFYRQDEKTITE